MPSTQSSRRSASKGEAASENAPLKRFYFPTIDNGVTILATSQEEADAKAAALLAGKAEAPAEDKPSNE